MAKNIFVFVLTLFCTLYGTFGVSLLDDKIRIKSPDHVYYTQESWFICEASSTVFTNGFKWYLNHTGSGEFEYLGEGDELLNPGTQLYQVNKTVLFSSLEISAIICSGKLLNGSNEYFNKSKAIQVRVGTKPKIVTKPQTIDPFQLFKIRCEAEGDPLPEFKWIFGKAELPKPFVIPGRFSTSYGQNWTEFESFIQVGKEYENFNLSCLAKNYVGHDEIIFLSLFKKPTWPYFLGGSILLVTFSAAIIVLLIRKIRRSKNKIRFLLSTEEIEEFRNGNEILAKENLSDPSKHIEYLPYNQNFEISKDDICIEHEKVLGEGAYGLVIHGYLKGQSQCQYERIKGLFVKSQNPQEVAIKTIKPHSGTQYLKTLLYEIKLMIFIKENPNIVKFYGSITADLVKGRVYMVFEYCQNGNLLEFLRRHRYEFQNSALPTSGYTSIFFSQQESDIEHCECENGLKKSSSYVKFPKVREFSIVNLYKWALDISMGVEYLHKNKIIHADLAARNILLSDDLTAKITDFGLSRHLYEYSNYVKQSQEPLPWRSMSLESLRDMTFSFKSDIWSFGVTLWEVFTLGQVPYPGYSWNPQFIEELLQGMRMNKPQFANEQLYQKLLDCWNIDPEKRPNISNFIQFFSQVLVLEQSDKKISQDELLPSIL